MGRGQTGLGRFLRLRSGGSGLFSSCAIESVVLLRGFQAMLALCGGGGKGGGKGGGRGGGSGVEPDCTAHSKDDNSAMQRHQPASQPTSQACFSLSPSLSLTSSLLTATLPRMKSTWLLSTTGVQRERCRDNAANSSPQLLRKHAPGPVRKSYL